MKDNSVQVKVTLAPSLYEQVKLRADEVGSTIATYLRILAINDLRASEEERLGSLVKTPPKATETLPVATMTPPQVIVVNNDGDYRQREGRAGTTDSSRRNHAHGPRPRQTVRLDDVLKML